MIYHLAAHGVSRAQNQQAEILETNLQGTANLLEVLARHDYRALVHTGSSSEYGHKDRPMREDDPLEPRTAYAVSKAAATLLCQSEAYRGRMIANVRIFSVYGPWEDAHRLVAYVIDCCRRGEAPRVTNGAQPSRLHLRRRRAPIAANCRSLSTGCRTRVACRQWAAMQRAR